MCTGLRISFRMWHFAKLLLQALQRGTRVMSPTSSDEWDMLFDHVIQGYVIGMKARWMSAVKEVGSRFA